MKLQNSCFFKKSRKSPLNAVSSNLPSIRCIWIANRQIKCLPIKKKLRLMPGRLTLNYNHIQSSKGQVNSYGWTTDKNPSRNTLLSFTVNHNPNASETLSCASILGLLDRTYNNLKFQNILKRKTTMPLNESKLLSKITLSSDDFFIQCAQSSKFLLSFSPNYLTSQLDALKHLTPENKTKKQKLANETETTSCSLYHTSSVKY